VAISGVVVAIVVAGCGGTSHKSSTTNTATSSSSRQLGPRAPAAFVSRLLAAEEMRGFVPQGQPAYASRPENWVVLALVPEAEQAEEVASLKRLGFIAAARESLGPSAAQEAGSGAEGLSIVEQLRSASAARTRLAAVFEKQKASSKPGELTTFALAPLPGARGFALANPQTTGVYVAFTSGPYYYLVGANWPATAGDEPVHGPLVAETAEHLYDRVRGLPGSS
jgi:hypothetical protein